MGDNEGLEDHHPAGVFQPLSYQVNEGGELAAGVVGELQQVYGRGERRGGRGREGRAGEGRGEEGRGGEGRRGEGKGGKGGEREGKGGRGGERMEGGGGKRM